MKVYKYCSGKIHENEVIKETKLMYFLKDGFSRAFGWSSRIRKEDAFTSPIDALNYSIEKQRNMVARYKKLTHESNTELGQMEKLLRQLKKSDLAITG